MFDREFKQEPYRAPKSYGRNERVTIEKDGNTKELKYKKATKLMEDGWSLIEV